MAQSFNINSGNITFDDFGRVSVQDSNLANALQSITDISDLVACNTCTNNTGACGSTANTGTGCNEVNGSCSTSFVRPDEFEINGDLIKFKNKYFNRSILEARMSNIEDLELVMDTFKLNP